jgi:hypothetical protein
MSRSEIFNNYFKIAQDQGILSESDKAAKQLQKTRRMDSLTIDAIEKLYNLKPDASEGLDYKNNIMESAHPDSLVISPAYDKLNGLIENNIERQNIMLRIVNKTPDGLLTQRKYAQKELILSLVRTANELDNQNKDQLRILADSCLNSINKKAAGPAALAFFSPTTVFLAGAAFAVSYLVSKMDDLDRGFEGNHERLITNLQNILDNEVTLGFGFELTDKGKEDIKHTIDILNKFKDQYNQAKPILTEATMSKTAAEMAQKADQNPELFRELHKQYNILLKSIANITPVLNIISRKFENPESIGLYIKEKGTMTSLLESTGLTGESKWSFWSGPFRDLLKSIPSYKQSLDNILEAAKDSIEVGKGQQKVLEDYNRQLSQALPVQLEAAQLSYSPDTVSQPGQMTAMPSARTTMPEYSGMTGLSRVPTPQSTLGEYGVAPNNKLQNHPAFADLSGLFSTISPSTTLSEF